MIHRFDPKAAPRVFLLPTAAVALLAGSVVLMLVGLTLVGVIGLGITLYVGYHLIKYTILQFRSNVEWDETSISCVTSLGLKISLEWKYVTLGGVFETAKGERYRFVYADEGDDLLTVPPHYTESQLLEQAVRQNSDRFLTLKGRSADDIAETLKPYVEGDEER